MLDNWKTTVAGIAVIAFAVYQAARFLTGEGDIESVRQAILQVLALFAAGAGLVAAKDAK